MSAEGKWFVEEQKQKQTIRKTEKQTEKHVSFMLAATLNIISDAAVAAAVAVTTTTAIVTTHKTLLLCNNTKNNMRVSEKIKRTTFTR